MVDAIALDTIIEAQGGLHLDTTLVRALLVDLDGTLYPAAPVRLAMAAELLLGHWHALSVLRVFRQEQERLRGTAHEMENAYRKQIATAAEKTGLAVAEMDALVEKWMHVRPGKWLRVFRRKWLLSFLQNFRAQGGRTALVSDYPAREKLRALRAAEYFDVVVANGEWPGLTQLKPSPQGYLLAARELDVPPSECLILGDREDTDGMAARHAGIRFCQIGKRRSVSQAELTTYLYRVQ